MAADDLAPYITELSAVIIILAMQNTWIFVTFDRYEAGVNIKHLVYMPIRHQALTDLPLDKMAANLADDIFIAIFMNKNIVFWLKFHWSLFLGVQLTIGQHWFR